jgi:hypothetical protein
MLSIALAKSADQSISGGMLQLQHSCDVHIDVGSSRKSVLECKLQQISDPDRYLAQASPSHLYWYVASLEVVVCCTRCCDMAAALVPSSCNQVYAMIGVHTARVSEVML